MSKIETYAQSYRGRREIIFLFDAGRVGEEETMMECLKSLEAFNCSDWETWRTNIRERIAVAHRFGVPDETVKTIAVKVGDFLSEKVCPATKEEELLKAMWSLATPDEKKTLTTLILKWFDH